VQNAFVGIEHLTDEELDDIRERCEQRAAAAEKAIKKVEERADDAATDA